MTRTWNLIEVDNEIFVPFEWRDTTPGGGNLGRVGFQVCLKFRCGKVSEFWVYPKQTRLETYWHVTNCDTSFSISAFQGLENPKVWLINWCAEHKTQTLNIYAPTESKFVWLNNYGITFLRTKFGEKETD